MSVLAIECLLTELFLSQMCSFCFHRIVDSEGNKCPACRRSYNPDNYTHLQVRTQEYVLVHPFLLLLHPIFTQSKPYVCPCVRIRDYFLLLVILTASVTSFTACMNCGPCSAIRIDVDSEVNLVKES